MEIMARIRAPIPAWALLTVVGLVAALPAVVVGTTSQLTTDAGQVKQCSDVTPLTEKFCLGSGGCFGFCNNPEYFVGRILSPPLGKGELRVGSHVRIWSVGGSGLFGPGDVVAITIEGRSHSIAQFGFLELIQESRSLIQRTWFVCAVVLLAAFALFLRQHRRPIRSVLSLAGGVIATVMVAAVFEVHWANDSGLLPLEVAAVALLGVTLAMAGALTSFPYQGRSVRTVFKALGNLAVPPAIAVLFAYGATLADLRRSGFYSPPELPILWLTIVAVVAVVVAVMIVPFVMRARRSSEGTDRRVQVAPGATAGLALVTVLFVQVALTIPLA